jgi:hypothetical protein
MLKKLFTVTVLGIAATAGLLATGCAATTTTAAVADKPYALTANVSQQRQDELRYTDQKGRYRADLQVIGRPQRP